MNFCSEIEIEFNWIWDWNWKKKESEIKIFDVINSAKEKIYMQVPPVERSNEVY